MGSRSLTIVVAEDHFEMRTVVSKFLNEHFCVLASVARGDCLVRAATELRPDLIVSDVEMPGMDGLEAMLQLKRSGLEIPFVLMGAETKGIAHLLAKGASAYVHKYDIHADLAEAIRLAVDGKAFVSRSIQEKD